MNFFLILNGKKMKNYTTIILTALVTAWFLYIQNYSFAVFSTEEGPRAIYKGKEGIALTFNITWGDTKAGPIIDTLIKEEVKGATFFLSGSWAERHPHIVEKITKAGYEIGILGHEYADYEDMEDSEIRRDILKAEEVFKKLNIKNIKYLRSPNGHFNKRLIQITDKMGYTVVHWSINTNDWKNPGVNSIVDSVKKAKNGDIILLHASDSATQTAVALPQLIKELRDKKMRFVTLSELLIDGKAKTKEINE